MVGKLWDLLIKCGHSLWLWLFLFIKMLEDLYTHKIIQMSCVQNKKYVCGHSECGRDTCITSKNEIKQVR